MWNRPWFSHPDTLWRSLCEVLLTFHIHETVVAQLEEHPFLCCWAAVNLSYLQALAGASADHRCPSARTCFFLLPAREGADVQSLRDTSCSAAGSKSRGSCSRRAELRAQGFALHLAAKNRPLYFSDAQSVISDNLDTLWCQRLLVDLNHIVVRLTEAFTHREWKTQVQEQIE